MRDWRKILSLRKDSSVDSLNCTRKCSDNNSQRKRQTFSIKKLKSIFSWSLLLLAKSSQRKTPENNKVTFSALKEEKRRKKSRRLHWKVRKRISRGFESDSKVDSPNCVTPKFVLSYRLTRVHVTTKSFPLWSRFSASQISCWHANLVSKCLQKASLRG